VRKCGFTNIRVKKGKKKEKKKKTILTIESTHSHLRCGAAMINLVVTSVSGGNAFETMAEKRTL
jgi:uncharacterized protein YcbX